MRTHHVTMSSLAVVLIGITSLGANSVWATGFDFFKKGDQSVCYQKRALIFGSVSFLRLNVKRHSPLTTFKEKKESGLPVQTTYSAIGKLVIQIVPPRGPTRMEMAEGSVVVTEKNGARMAITVSDLFGSVKGTISHLECRTETSSATPAKWSSCKGLRITDGGIFPESHFELVRVNPLEHELCSFFEAVPPTD